jgi:anti-anti-sigma factor
VRTKDHFQLTVEESGAESHLRLVGEFDRAVVGRVEQALDRIFRPPLTRGVVIDLRLVTFLDGAALLTILRANERARAAALQLVVARPRGTANRVFTLTRAHEALSMVDEPGAKVSNPRGTEAFHPLGRLASVSAS